MTTGKLLMGAYLLANAAVAGATVAYFTQTKTDATQKTAPQPQMKTGRTAELMAPVVQ